MPLARIEKLDNGRGRREADLRGALNNPAGNGEAAPAGTPEDADDTAETKPEQEDYQLARAIDLLRGIDLYQQRIVN